MSAHCITVRSTAPTKTPVAHAFPSYARAVDDAIGRNASPEPARRGVRAGASGAGKDDAHVLTELWP